MVGGKNTEKKRGRWVNIKKKRKAIEQLTSRKRFYHFVKEFNQVELKQIFSTKLNFFPKTKNKPNGSTLNSDYSEQKISFRIFTKIYF